MYGILFDLDGTLTESDPVHFEAWQQILSEYNQVIDREAFNKRISGRLNADITRDLLPDLSESEQQEVSERKESLFRELGKEKLKPTKGLQNVIEYLKQNRSKYKIGLATNAPRLVTDFELGILKLDEKTFFDAVIVAEEFGCGKPKPDIYLELARRLNVDRASCVVFEDSPSGVQAAVAAQIKCIGVLTSATKQALEQLGTWKTVKNFEEVNLEHIVSELQATK